MQSHLDRNSSVELGQMSGPLYSSDLLQQGVDRSVIALWLGHESIETTEVYLHASMAMKEKALARATPSKTRNGRYRPADRLLAFLKSL